MTARWRLGLLIAAMLALAPAVWAVVTALPPFGSPTAAYGQVVNRLLPHLRTVSNMVAAVNFDVRGLDTLGEESMLLCAVTGAVVLLRGSRGEDRAEHAGRVPGRATIERDDASIVVCRIGAPILLAFSAYVALHGTVTPGGGFQAGAIAVSALLLVYLGDGYARWRSRVPHPLMAFIEGLGALLFVLCAALPLAWSVPALTSLLPTGKWKDLYSGGLMVPVNIGVALAVLGGFAVLVAEFMEETRTPESDPVPDEEDA
ncbi:MAG: hypothetical protein JOY99_10480 [Sphingomonadaceae bacterium]|nr:hypothetical protein [Sphingomonadaceae bacterium]